MLMNHAKAPTDSLRLQVALGILAVMILTACSGGSETSAPASTPNPVQDIVWQWIILTNQSTGVTTTVPSPENYTITFKPDGTLEGKADCNTFTGSYSQENGFSIKLGATTMMYCGEASLDQEYLQLLGSVAAGGPDSQGNLALETPGGEQRMLFVNSGAATK